MNVNELNVHKSTLFLCLQNDFLKKLTLHYFSVVVGAITPEEICRGKFEVLLTVYHYVSQ
jgi:hypothetical protein